MSEYDKIIAILQDRRDINAIYYKTANILKERDELYKRGFNEGVKALLDLLEEYKD